MTSSDEPLRPATTTYPILEQVILAHSAACRISRSQSLALLNHPDFLESALARPQQYAHYEGADLVRQAAILLHALVTAHAFVDGNKRAAVGTLYIFLFLNGWWPTVEARDVADWALACATGATIDELANVMDEALEPRPDLFPA